MLIRILRKFFLHFDFCTFIHIDVSKYAPDTRLVLFACLLTSFILYFPVVLCDTVAFILRKEKFNVNSGTCVARRS